MKGRSLLGFAVLSLALACEGNQQPIGPTAPSDPSKIIQDGAHGGNKDFWWLPPMVPLPLHNPDFVLGTFNNALRPSLRIEICQLDGLHLNAQGVPTAQTACAAGIPLKKTFPAGTVNLVNLPIRQFGWWNLFDLPPDGFYYALWDTHQSNLDVSKFYRISVFVQGKPDALGVADVDPMSSLRQWKYSLTGQVIQLIDDVMLPITFRVERGALCESGQCNSATISSVNPNGSGSQSITVDAGGGSITGATFPDHWLPSPSQCAPNSPCPQSVVVTINEVNTPGSGLPGEPTVCHPALNPKLKQFRGCFHFSTTPALQPFNEAHDQFAQPVTVAVCYELEGTNDPRKNYAELYASGPNELPHRLDDVSEGVLVVSKDCFRPTIVGYRGANPLVQLASSGWQKLKEGLDRAFGVKTAYAVDLGLGGIVKGFSNISPVLSATVESYSSTELTLSPGATTTSTVRIMGSSHHSDHAPSGIGGVAVTFTASSGALSAATVTTAIDGTASVNWTMPAGTGTGPYVLTADGPALGGPVTFTATVVGVRHMLSMQTGATIQLPGTEPDAIATWLSSAPTKVQVGEAGLVTAIVGGEDSTGGAAARLTTVLSTGLPGPTWLVDTVFDIFPRTTTLAWAPVSGAATYTIATEYGNGCIGFAICTLWEDNGVGTTTTTVLSFTFDFVGAQPGRWHVTARDANGTIIPGQVNADGFPIADSPSPWIYFRYSM